MKCPICSKNMILDDVDNHDRYGMNCDKYYICEDENCETHAITKIRNNIVIGTTYYNSSSIEPIKIEVGNGKHK